MIILNGRYMFCSSGITENFFLCAAQYLYNIQNRPVMRERIRYSTASNNAYSFGTCNRHRCIKRFDGRKNGKRGSTKHCWNHDHESISTCADRMHENRHTHDTRDRSSFLLIQLLWRGMRGTRLYQVDLATEMFF